MKTTITLLAFVVFGLQFSNATTMLPVTTNFSSELTTQNVDPTKDVVVEARVYFWKVETAHGIASGYSSTLEKAEKMMTAATKGDYSRSLILMSNPR